MSSFVETIPKIRDAVVAIGHPVELADGKFKLNIWGSGFCASADGLIVTCAHVAMEFVKFHDSSTPQQIEEAGDAAVPVNVHTPVVLFFQHIDNKWRAGRFAATGLIASKAEDIALITLGPGLLPNGKTSSYPFLELDTKVQSEGEEVGCAGFPLGDDLQETMRSATRSFHFGHVGAVLPYPMVTEPTWYQLDVHINPGNSGGPVFRKSDGKVIGIVSSTLMAGADRSSPTGIAYAVPAHLIQREIAEYELHGKQKLHEVGSEGHRIHGNG